MLMSVVMTPVSQDDSSAGRREGRGEGDGQETSERPDAEDKLEELSGKNANLTAARGKTATTAILYG